MSSCRASFFFLFYQDLTSFVKQSEKSIYLRVKRPQQTVFLTTEPTETVAVAKNRLAVMCEYPAANIRLGYGDEILKDDNTIAFYKIDNGAEVFQMQLTG